MRQTAIRSGGALLLLVMVACGEVGSGEIVSEPRTVAEFDRLVVADGVQVELTVGEAQSHMVTSVYDDNLQERVSTEVVDGVLTIEIQGSIVGSGSDRRVVVTMPDLVGLEASGGANLDASGAAEAVVVEVDGGATVDLSDLVVQTMQVDVAAGAQVSVTAQLAISGEVSGGASLVVEGDPFSSEIEVSGGGTVTE